MKKIQPKTTFFPNKLYCFNVYWFNHIMERVGVNRDGVRLPNHVAIISILDPEERRGEEYHYFLPNLLFNSDRILNIDFDDVNGDSSIWDNYYRTEPDKFIVYKNELLKPITDKQAEEIVQFIIKNLGKHFIIHCYAGVSRSKAVTQFIFDTFDGYDKSDCKEWSDKEIPNKFVLKKLKEAYNRLKTN